MTVASLVSGIPNAEIIIRDVLVTSMVIVGSSLLIPLTFAGVLVSIYLLVIVNNLINLSPNALVY